MTKKELLKLAKESLSTNVGLDELSNSEFENDPRIKARKQIQELSCADLEQVKKYQKMFIKHPILRFIFN